MNVWISYGRITQSFYRCEEGILLFYDITDRKSFENVNDWLIDIEKYAKKYLKILLIGNKTDLEKERKVTYEEGQEFAKSHNLLFIETSVKENYNVQESIELLTKEINKVFDSQNKKNNNKDKTVHLLPENFDNKRKKNC